MRPQKPGIFTGGDGLATQPRSTNMRTSGKANIRLQYRLHCHQAGTIRVMHSPMGAKKVRPRRYRYRTNAAPEIKVGDAVLPGPIKHTYSIYYIAQLHSLLFLYQPMGNMMNIRIVYASNSSQTHMSHIKLMRQPADVCHACRLVAVLVQPPCRVRNEGTWVPTCLALRYR